MSDIEYWEASGAFDTVDPSGARDLRLPSNVRIYQFSSTQHGGFSPVAPLPTSAGICEQLPNANSYTYNLRALLVALQKWVAKGVAPPPSRYSTLAKGTLVPPDSVAFPSIPNVTGPHGIWNTRLIYARGSQYNADKVSGVVSTEPPVAGAVYPTLLPQVDADGNGTAGVRMPELSVPLVMVLGHSECGAVKAAIKHMDDRDALPGALGELVNRIRPAVAKAKGMPGDRLDNAIDIAVALFPEPDSPTSPTLCPAEMSKLTPSTARTVPPDVRKCVWRSRTSSSAPAVMASYHR